MADVVLCAEQSRVLRRHHFAHLRGPGDAGLKRDHAGVVLRPGSLLPVLDEELDSGADRRDQTQLTAAREGTVEQQRLHGHHLLTGLEIAFENPLLFDLAGHGLGEIGEKGKPGLLGLGGLLGKEEVGDLGGDDLNEGLVFGGIHDLVKMGAQPADGAARVFGSDHALPDATGAFEDRGHRGVELGTIVGVEPFQPGRAASRSPVSEEMPQRCSCLAVGVVELAVTVHRKNHGRQGVEENLGAAAQTGQSVVHGVLIEQASGVLTGGTHDGGGHGDAEEQQAPHHRGIIGGAAQGEDDDEIRPPTSW